MMNQAGDSPKWAAEGSSRIPFWVYTDPTIYQRELARFFYRAHWCYVGLTAEIPQPGDFKRSRIGERSVIMARIRTGEISVVENVCAHRGVQFCRKTHGNARGFICPYHQGSYTLEGDLMGVPFRLGFKQNGKVNGGMPTDFRTADHGLTKLKVAVRGGVVFASFDHAVEPLEEYLGPDMLYYFDRVFNGRQLVILGYNKQRIPGNWKLMQENIKDPYHPGLLHTWFVNYRLSRADNECALKMDARHRHAAMVTTRGIGPGDATATAGVSSFKENMEIHDKRLLDIVPEPWWNGPTGVMLTLFPSVVIQQQVNSVSTRCIQPNGE
jgi:salicylate 5-hydroxylase large subunit